MASEASYVYILSGQKFIKNAQNSLSWRVLESLKLLIGQKLVENATFLGIFNRSSALVHFVKFSHKILLLDYSHKKLDLRHNECTFNQQVLTTFVDIWRVKRVVFLVLYAIFYRKRDLNTLEALCVYC